MSKYALFSLLILFCSFHTMYAGEIQPRLTAGGAAFLDEETPLDHSIIGGSVEFYLTPRLSVAPELIYMRGPGTDRDLTLMGNMAYDLARFGKNSVYVVGGAGILHNTAKFPGSIDPVSSFSEWTAGGGVGAKLFLSNSIFVAPEFRFGWEPLYRITGSIGFTLGKH